jgi:hypothetical protein
MVMDWKPNILDIHSSLPILFDFLLNIDIIIYMGKYKLPLIREHKFVSFLVNGYNGTLTMDFDWQKIGGNYKVIFP